MVIVSIYRPNYHKEAQIDGMFREEMQYIEKRKAAEKLAYDR